MRDSDKNEKETGKNENSSCKFVSFLLQSLKGRAIPCALCLKFLLRHT